MPTKMTALFTDSTNKSGTLPAGVRVAGWSESWWYDGTITAAQVSMHYINTARAGLLPNSAAIVGQRYQSTDGGSSTTAFVYPGTNGNLTDVPQMALLCFAQGAGRPNVRRFTLRGIPDIYVYEGEFGSGSNWTALWGLWTQQLERYGAKFRARDLSQPRLPFLSINLGGLVTTAATHGLAPGAKIQFFRLRDQYNRPVKGVFTVTAAPTTTTFQLQNYELGECGAGEYRRVVDPIYCSVQAAAVLPIRAVVRKVGRPFGQYRGRASRRK